MLNASQRLMNRAALSAESFSRMPASCFGWFATMPTGRPPKRAKQVMIVLRPLRLDVEVLAVVDDPLDHVVHVVRVPRRLGHDVEQLLVHAVDRVRGLADRRLLLAVGREERQVRLDRLDALAIVGDLEVADARLAAVDLGAAEVLHADVLAGDRLHEMRAGERHRALSDDHRHEVGEPRDVGGARGAGSEHARDERDARRT